MFTKSKIFGLALLACLVACFPIGGSLLQPSRASAGEVIIKAPPIVRPVVPAPIVVRLVVPASIVRVGPVYGNGYWYGGRWYWRR